MKNVTEVDLNSILETLMGRTAPPTDAENTAHRAAGGLWRWVSTYNGEFLHWASKDLANWYFRELTDRNDMSVSPWRKHCDCLLCDEDMETEMDQYRYWAP